MKIVLASLVVLSVVACGRSSSSHKRANDVNQSNIEGTVVVGADGTVLEGMESKSPAVGVYLGSCEKQGAISFASGVEITAVEIRPVTAAFNDQNCARTALASFGYTGIFATFASYSNFLNTNSRAAGDPITASFLDTSITFASESGNKLSLMKSDLVLATDKRLKISVTEQTYDSANKAFKGRINIANSIFNADRRDFSFYCKKDGKLLRQEATYSDINGVIMISAKLNTWNAVTLPTVCQVSMNVRHGSKSTDFIDLAYSQELPVK